jgi:hypothetical protein
MLAPMRWLLTVVAALVVLWLVGRLVSDDGPSKNVFTLTDGKGGTITITVPASTLTTK